MTYRTFVAHLCSFGFCLFLSGGALSGAQAAEAPARPIALTDQQANERADFLDRQFDAQQHDAKLWMYGWGAFNGGSLIFSTAQAIHTDKRKDRDMNIVQSVESLIGVADILFRPLPAFEADSVCPQKITTREERQQCLAAKEALAQRGAERANEPYQIRPHIETLGMNLVAGGIVWGLAGFTRAVVTAVPGEVIGEIQLWTTPGQPSSDYRDYQVQFSPMGKLSSRGKDPVVGIEARWRF